MSWGFLVSSPQTSAAHHPGVIGLDKAGLEKCTQLGDCSPVIWCITLKIQNCICKCHYPKIFQLHHLKKMEKYKTLNYIKNLINWLVTF